MIYCYTVLHRVHRHVRRRVRRALHHYAAMPLAGVTIACVVVGGGVALGLGNGDTVNHGVPPQIEGDSQPIDVPEPSSLILLLLPSVAIHLWAVYRAARL